MAPTSSPSKHEEIPKVSYRTVDANEDALATGLTLKLKMDASTATWRFYGFNPLGQDFARDEHYIRYIEPIEAELAHQVEYDMDEQDREWLDATNEERRLQQLDKVSYELFEVIMDKLEKEWFKLVKRIPSAAGDVPTEDSKCAICDDAEGENSNAIVFCDGCNLAVHQDCYGVPYIPEGQWLCRKCTVEPENPVDCIFCPAEAGAFKQTTEAHWAHLLCAIWIPEVGVSNPVYMEPIEGEDGVPKTRWKLICSICRVKMGACIQCDNRNCFTAFHVTCARAQGLLGSMKGAGHDGTLRAHCHRHLTAERQAELLEEGIVTDETIFTDTPARPSSAVDRKKFKKANNINPHLLSNGSRQRANNSKQAKSARAHAKSYQDGPPLVPAVIVKSILDYTTKGKVRKPRELIEKVCRYWSLKREARRGAPLLKRLYLEPWTASNASKDQTDAEKAKKLEYLVLVRNDLERVRMLAELVKKREAEKYRQAQIIQGFVNDFLFPHDAKLRQVFTSITALDRQNLFLEPANRNDVPDYYAVIQRPMSWSVISEKLDARRYRDLDAFQADIYLTLDNAMTYNPSDNPYHKAAAKIKKAAGDLLADLRILFASESGSSSALPSDLEASSDWLSSILDPIDAEDENSMDILASLFSNQFAKLIPPELPPLPKPKKVLPTPAERRAHRDAELARKLASGTVSLRTTRAMAPLDLPLSPSTPQGTPRRGPGRPPKQKVPQSPTMSSSSDTIKPLRKPQRGVAGIAAYSPLDLHGRLRRERELGLIVDNVEEKDHFKRFNVGWVLPEGMKRGGRPVRNETPPTEPKASRSKGKGWVKDDIVQPEAGPSNAVQRKEVTTPKRKSRPPALHFTPSSSSTLSSLTESEAGSPRMLNRAKLLQQRPSPVITALSITSSAREAEAAADLADEVKRQRTRRRGRGNEDQPTTDVMGVDVEPQSALAGPSRGGVVQVQPKDSQMAIGSPGQDDIGRSQRARQKRKMSDEHYSPPAPTKRRKMTKQADLVSKGLDAGAVTPRRGRPPTAKIASPSLSPPPEQEVIKVAKRRPRAATPEESATTPAQIDPVRAPALDIEGAVDLEAEGERLEAMYEARMKELRGTNGAEGAPEDGEDPFPEGTLVWAKMHGFPYFPASIVDIPEDYDNIPEAVWTSKPSKATERVWLVRFYDAKRTLGWCIANRLTTLGEKDDIDQLYLIGRDRKNTKAAFKANAAIAKSVRDGYSAAKAEMAIEGDEGWEA